MRRHYVRTVQQDPTRNVEKYVDNYMSASARPPPPHQNNTNNTLQTKLRTNRCERTAPHLAPARRRANVLEAGEDLGPQLGIHLSIPIVPEPEISDARALLRVLRALEPGDIVVSGRV
jgi:hypothetical protein